MKENRSKMKKNTTVIVGYMQNIPTFVPLLLR